MFLKIRRLGVIFVVLAAAGSAVAASATAATIHDFEAEESTFIVTGKTTKKQTAFQFGSGAAVTCEASSFSKTTKGPTASLTAQPTYSGCELGGAPASVDATCSYFFTGTTDAFGHGPVHVECENELVGMRITANGCTIEIPTQTPKTGVTFKNTGAGSTRDVDLKVTMTETEYKLVGALCGLIAGLGGELSIVGEYTMTAYKDELGAEGKQIGFWTKTTIT